MSINDRIQSDIDDSVCRLSLRFKLDRAIGRAAAGYTKAAFEIQIAVV